jgi:hypothetical protein
MTRIVGAIVIIGVAAWGVVTHLRGGFLPKNPLKFAPSKNMMNERSNSADDVIYRSEKDVEAKFPPYYIERIEAIGEPVFGERLCYCGGTVRYGEFRLETFLEDEDCDLVIEHVHAHGCHKCGSIVGFDKVVAEEIETRLAIERSKRIRIDDVSHN